jgi:hypothetical protein
VLPRVFLAVGLIALSGCSPGSGSVEAGPADVVFTGGATLRVRVADTDPERERGLTNVADLPDDEGMAFVWDAPTTARFWMKDTRIPLAIAFVGSDGRIVTILEMTPCGADPCETYGAAEPYTLAIEANQGWFAGHGVAVGDIASLSSGRPTP